MILSIRFAYAPTISPQEYVAKRRRSELKGSASKQEYFIDICHLVGHPTPIKSDPRGISFGLENETEKVGWAWVCQFEIILKFRSIDYSNL